MNYLYIDVQCPYCGRRQRAIQVEPQSSGRELIPKIIFCDHDLDGCDKFYLVAGTIEVKATVSVLPAEKIAQKINGNGRLAPIAEVTL